VNLCDSRQVLGVSCGVYRRNGAFAEYVAVPAHIVYALPIEAVSIAVHAAKITKNPTRKQRRSNWRRDDRLLAVQSFRQYGCEKAFAVDLEQNKLDVARRLGADETFLATDLELMHKSKPRLLRDRSQPHRWRDDEAPRTVLR
jgi:L-iditol 2-dehydrogenase